jgi:hypothetical protein
MLGMCLANLDIRFEKHFQEKEVGQEGQEGQGQEGEMLHLKQGFLLFDTDHQCLWLDAMTFFFLSYVCSQNTHTMIEIYWAFSGLMLTIW